MNSVWCPDRPPPPLASLIRLRNLPPILRREAERAVEHDGTVEQESFRDFVSRVRPAYRWYEHCKRLAEVLQRVADGEIKRLMIFMPPRHGKSELASRLFTAYWLSRFPHQWVGLNCFGQELANTLSRAARENFLVGGGKIRSDASAVKHWETTTGGGMWSAGIGGPILGKGWHLGVIDDPVKNAEQAFSETVQASHREWYDSTFYTREEPTEDNGNPDGALVIINQRWSGNDLCAWLFKREEDDDESPERWHVVVYEAIKEDAPYELPPTCTIEPDWRAPGEALFPERRPLSKLERLKKKNPFFFSAMYQQRPRPKEGGLFPAGCLPTVEAPPRGLTYVRYWDKAGAKPGKGDWTVGVLMGRDEEQRYWVIDVVRGQWQADQRNQIILETAKSDKARFGRVAIWVEQPPGLAKESTDAVVRMLSGFNVQADPVNRDKVERAEPLSAQCHAKNVKVVAGDNISAYLAVMHAFPFGLHDDDVDASSGAFNKLAGEIASTVTRGRGPQFNLRGGRAF